MTERLSDSENLDEGRDWRRAGSVWLRTGMYRIEAILLTQLSCDGPVECSPVRNLERPDRFPHPVLWMEAALPDVTVTPREETVPDRIGSIPAFDGGPDQATRPQVICRRSDCFLSAGTLSRPWQPPLYLRSVGETLHPAEAFYLV